jgi:hypothetical protein
MQCTRRRPTPSYDQNRGLRGLQDSGTLQLYGQTRSKTNTTAQKEANSLDQDVYGIEIEKRLERQVGENEERK